MSKQPEQDPRIVTITFDIGETPQSPRMAEREAIDYILASLHGGPAESLQLAFGTIRSVKSYRRLIRHAAKVSIVSPDFRDRFHTAWTVAGFRWRDAINNDVVLSRALRSVLQNYDGDNQTLYRGEQAARYDAGRIGFNWASKQDVAKMCASGLCSLYEGGGVLLKADVPSAAIISYPGSHSQHLGEDEYIVDPNLLADVVELTRYPKT